VRLLRANDGWTCAVHRLRGLKAVLGSL
jgi:hypothetical protein